jgi:hypothetical protein
MLFRAWAVRSGPKSPEVRTTRQTVNVGMTSSLFGAEWRKSRRRLLSRSGRYGPLQDKNPARPNQADFMACDYNIELFFRVLKQGCKIEQLHVQTDQRLLNALAIYVIVAWRIHNITMAGRAYPAVSCEVVFAPREWHILYTMQHHGHPPPTPPPLRDMVRSLAQLGGFLARKGDGEPGIKAIWQGYQRLHEFIYAVDTYRTVKALERNV